MGAVKPGTFAAISANIWSTTPRIARVDAGDVAQIEAEPPRARSHRSLGRRRGCRFRLHATAGGSRAESLNQAVVLARISHRISLAQLVVGEQGERCS